MKTCIDCKSEKSLEGFYNQRGNKDGKQGFCKDCGRLRANRWYAAKRKKDGIPVRVKRVSYRDHLEDKCRRCKFVPEDKCQLTIDHIDRDHKNNDVSNLQTLCANCHYLKSKVEQVSPEKLVPMNLVP